MDNGIVYNLFQIQPEDSQAKIELLGKYDPNGEQNIQDPLFVSICNINLSITYLYIIIYYLILLFIFCIIHFFNIII